MAAGLSRPDLHFRLRSLHTDCFNVGRALSRKNMGKT